MSRNLNAYLVRIKYDGPREPTRDVLRGVHRCHALTIPYENFDVILERPVDQDIDRIFHKLVLNGRGGWCYEQNGLLGWALSELGFDVRRLCGGVMRAFRGDSAFGNHLLLRVELDESWIADLGIGDSILEPMRLEEGERAQFGRTFRLEHLRDGEWRFHNHEGAIPPSFDFLSEQPHEDRLAQICDELQKDPESMFRQNLVCQQMTEAGAHRLLGRVLTLDTDQRRLLASERELLDVLQDVFGIQLPPCDGLWDRVVARHEALFGDTPVEAIQFGSPPTED